ncbi:hypothetical protein [Nonomuraea dietziae]|uniref:hypothetical protein n=1 Tax=Nonomuraea dietziae TaxID=65515 RepID=UPI0031D30593
MDGGHPRVLGQLGQLLRGALDDDEGLRGRLCLGLEHDLRVLGGGLGGDGRGLRGVGELDDDAAGPLGDRQPLLELLLRPALGRLRWRGLL